jgi:hypothetical protein
MRFVLIAVAMFVTSIVPTLQARPCSNATTAGEYGYVATGSLVFTTGVIPVAGVGRITEHEDGTLSGMQTRSLGGVVSHQVLRGTFSTNSDCTSTITAQLFDPTSGAPLGTALMSVVIVDNGRKQQGIFTGILGPAGEIAPNVISIVADRLDEPKD